MAKLLLVEDNEMNWDMLSRRLSRKGYEVIRAVDGIEAIEMTKSDLPDLILMDMGLPRLNGWEATKRIKADPTTQDIPIIALTSHAMIGDRERALASGCNDYDVKPIDFTRLLGKIQALLEQ